MLFITKIAFHRASMKAYQTDLEINGATVHYVEAHQPQHDVRVLITNLATQGIQQIRIIDPTDTYLGQRIRSSCRKYQIELNQIESPLFLNTPEQNKTFFKSTKKSIINLFFTKNNGSPKRSYSIKINNPSETSGPSTPKTEKIP